MLGRNMDHFVDPNPAKPQGLRLGDFQPDSRFLRGAAIGLAAVFLCYALRLRYPWWPVHPVLFVAMGTYLCSHFAASFFLGWLVKSAVTHFGGGRTYQKCKPIFIGLVAAEFAAAIFWAIVGLIYYVHSGVPGPVFRAHP